MITLSGVSKRYVTKNGTVDALVGASLPEAYSSIVLALTTSVVGLLGATAMAGYGGGGGVGDLALTYGRERFNTPLMVFTVVILVIFVQLMQAAGNYVSRRLRDPR